MNLTVYREGKYAIVWMTNAEKADDGKETILPKHAAGARQQEVLVHDTTPHRLFLPQSDGIGVENT